MNMYKTHLFIYVALDAIRLCRNVYGLDHGFGNNTLQQHTATTHCNNSLEQHTVTFTVWTMVLGSGSMVLGV